jgi:hypothetical protein
VTTFGLILIGVAVGRSLEMIRPGYWIANVVTIAVGLVLTIVGVIREGNRLENSYKNSRQNRLR